MDRQNLNQLRVACEYWLLLRMLRVAGTGSVIFGLLAVVRGISAMRVDPLAKSLAMIGLLLVIEGVWIMAVPRPSGLVMEGTAFVVVGLWNLFMFAIRGPAYLLALALVQLVWSIRYFRRYSRFSGLPGNGPAAGQYRG